MPEILPGVHKIPVDYNGRPLKLYLLLGQSASMLIDAGDARVPERDVLPYCSSIGFDPARLDYILITHPDVDHSAGLAAMKELAPRARLVCGTADRLQIESPEALVDVRARHNVARHGIGPQGDERDKLLARAGAFAPIDITFNGGETLRLGPGDAGLVHILHLPGHSHGHLGVYLPAHKSAIIGDAVHDRFSPFPDGTPALPVTYMYVDEYLSTLAQLSAMSLTGGLERLYSAHWPDKSSREEVNSWLDLSREYATFAERTILALVRAARQGITLSDLLKQIKPALGDWPANRDSAAHFFVAGHLDRLASLGLISATPTAPVRFAAAP